MCIHIKTGVFTRKNNINTQGVNPMKKIYEAPKLVNHGTVSNITAFTFQPGPQDTFFSGGVAVTEGTGSYDGCVTADGKVCK
jgi:hypothetical protein